MWILSMAGGFDYWATGTLRPPSDRNDLNVRAVTLDGIVDLKLIFKI